MNSDKTTEAFGILNKRLIYINETIGIKKGKSYLCIKISIKFCKDMWVLTEEVFKVDSWINWVKKSFCKYKYIYEEEERIISIKYI